MTVPQLKILTVSLEYLLYDCIVYELVEHEQAKLFDSLCLANCMSDCLTDEEYCLAAQGAGSQCGIVNY